MLQSIQNELFSLINYVLVTLVGIGVTYAIKFLKDKGVLAKLENHKEIANIAVQCVEQVSSQLNLHGTDKLNAAKTKALEILNSKGITISDSELTTLLENAVKTMNDSAKAALK